MKDSISKYLNRIEKALKRGNATEHTYRPALISLIESSASRITATNEPKRVECGAPDLIVSKGRIPLGYIETKDIDKPLNKIQKSDQFKRYLEGLGNLILTDYLEFRWYVGGDHKTTVRLATVGSGSRLKWDEKTTERFEFIVSEFLKTHIPVIKGPKELAGRMAGLAKLIRESLSAALSQKDSGGRLENILGGFKKVLIHNLTREQFADMYAQTVAYGLFAARCNWDGKDDFTREHAAYDLPKTNPFLRKIFTELAGPDLDERITWAVDDLAELLNRADIASILEDFGKRSKQEDPVVHFYETFLAAYDPKMREARGVYYTPEPVVSYIVRSVDHILKTDFGLSDGLADRSKVVITKEVYDKKKGGKKHKVSEELFKVLILDPAVGTGTFLHGVIDQIYWHLAEQGQKGAWSQYVSKYLLPRLFGFELLMVPYTVAHMKLGIQLQEFGYDFKSDERLGIYLTNTLEEAYKSSEHLFANWLVEEANAAVKVKLDMPILVVLGNPPYSGHSANTGNWIEKLLRGEDIRTKTKTESYFEVDGKPLGERNPKWLNDDYVKFIRFAQWRIERTGYGILAFISSNSYLDNPTFRGMRQSLMETFDYIHILNLHGSTKKREKTPEGGKDENVFDIQQGVAIGLFVKKKKRKNKYAKVRYSDLWGPRAAKYYILNESDIKFTDWETLDPQSPFYLFVPQDVELLPEYEEGWKITDIMAVNSVGIVTARDKLTIQWTEKEVTDVIENFASLPEEDARLKYNLGDDVRDWKVTLAQKDLLSHNLNRKHVVKILYRPFDLRFTFYTGRTRGFICMPRPEVMRHMMVGENLGLIATRQTKDNWNVCVTRNIIGHKSCSVYDIDSLFPLYLYPEIDLFNNKHTLNNGRKPNLSEKFIMDFSNSVKLKSIPDGKGDLKKTFGPEDIFNYIYAVFHSPTYRERYAEFLKIDFPKVPLTSNKKLFRVLCSLGEKLVGLHLMEKHGPSITSYPVDDDHVVEKVRYTEKGQGAEKGRVWINKTQYFEDVPKEVWEFNIGGYQVCHKWLKDRKGRTLSFDDIDHYQRIVSALSETIRLMNDIDEVIENYGSWPIT